MNGTDWKQPIARSRTFLEECWAELRKVHWPTFEETRAATIAVIIGVSALRLAGFAGTIVTLNYPSAVFIQYLLIGGTLLAGGYAISKGLIIEPPAHATRLMNAISEWYLRRIGATAGQTS